MTLFLAMVATLALVAFVAAYVFNVLSYWKESKMIIETAQPTLTKFDAAIAAVSTLVASEKAPLQAQIDKLTADAASAATDTSDTLAAFAQRADALDAATAVTAAPVVAPAPDPATDPNAPVAVPVIDPNTGQPIAA